MRTKKKLIARLALGAAAALVAGLATLAVALAALRAEREEWTEGQQRERQRLVERSREYLGELAGRIQALPVDASLVGEVESRYFEEQATAPLYVWAMSPGDEVLFGVPREVFNRLNGIYERDVVPRLKEGVYLDRQTFLRNLVDQSDEIEPGAFSEGGEEDEQAWRRWGRDRWEEEGSFMLSAPLRTADGAPLGSLYLKRGPLRERDHYRENAGLMLVADGATVMAVAALAFLWVLLPTWVYVDARERGVRRAALYAFLTVISSLIGFLVYLIARPEQARALQCPGCGRELNGGAFCPHCGRDLAAAFCAACRYPLEPDWVFCPACRTEIRPRSASGAAAPQATS